MIPIPPPRLIPLLPTDESEFPPLDRLLSIDQHYLSAYIPLQRGTHTSGVRRGGGGTYYKVGSIGVPVSLTLTLPAILPPWHVCTCSLDAPVEETQRQPGSNKRHRAVVLTFLIGVLAIVGVIVGTTSNRGS